MNFKSNLLFLSKADIITDFLGSNGFRARGVFGTSAQSLTLRYTDDLPFKTAIPGCSTQCQIYRALINKTTTDPDFVNNAGSFTNFIQRLLGDEAAHFIYDFERLKSYHQDANDAAFFMDTYQWSSRYDGPRAYPDEGMSQFPIRMLARFQSLGGQFFPNTRITQVNEESSGNFVLQSGDAVQFNAAKVALAFPSYDYTGLGGNVIDRIRLTPEFQSASPNPCVTVQQVFGKRFFSFFFFFFFFFERLQKGVALPLLGESNVNAGLVSRTSNIYPRLQLVRSHIHAINKVLWDILFRL